jgi:hypothetical protein
MSAKITKTNAIKISGSYMSLNATVTNGSLNISIVYPGDYRDSSQTLGIDGLDKADVTALRDFLNEYLAKEVSK